MSICKLILNELNRIVLIELYLEIWKISKVNVRKSKVAK